MLWWSRTLLSTQCRAGIALGNTSGNWDDRLVPHWMASLLCSMHSVSAPNDKRRIGPMGQGQRLFSAHEQLKRAVDSVWIAIVSTKSCNISPLLNRTGSGPTPCSNGLSQRQAAPALAPAAVEERHRNQRQVASGHVGDYRRDVIKGSRSCTAGSSSTLRPKARICCS